MCEVCAEYLKIEISRSILETLFKKSFDNFFRKYYSLQYYTYITFIKTLFRWNLVVTSGRYTYLVIYARMTDIYFTSTLYNDSRSVIIWQVPKLRQLRELGLGLERTPAFQAEIKRRQYKYRDSIRKNISWFANVLGAAKRYELQYTI